MPFTSSAMLLRVPSSRNHTPTPSSSIESTTSRLVELSPETSTAMRRATSACGGSKPFGFPTFTSSTVMAAPQTSMLTQPISTGTFSTPEAAVRAIAVATGLRTA